MKANRGFTLTEMVFVIVWLLVVISWVANIVKLYYLIFDPVTGLVILRILGVIVFPLGAILGLVPN